jgi:hypothetical protein
VLRFLKDERQGKGFATRLGNEIIPFNVIIEYYTVVKDETFTLAEIHPLVAYAYIRYGIKGNGIESLRPYARFHRDRYGQIAYFILDEERS